MFVTKLRNEIEFGSIIVYHNKYSIYCGNGFILELTPRGPYSVIETEIKPTDAVEVLDIEMDESGRTSVIKLILECIDLTKKEIDK